MNEKNIIESADGTARIKMSSIGHAEMKEFVEKYAEKTTKTYSDIFVSQLNDAVLNGVIRSKITEIISLCRRAGLDEEDTREACADLIWPICNYQKFPEIFRECMDENADDRFEDVYDCEDSAEPSYDDGRIDGALTLCKLFELSPTEAASHVTAAMEGDPSYVLERSAMIYGKRG